MSSNNNTSAPGELSKISGAYHSVKGTVVEAVGDLTGAQSWKQSGRDEHAAGEAEKTAAEAKAYAQATGDRLDAKVNNVVGALTGDKDKQTTANLKDDLASAKQSANKPI